MRLGDLKPAPGAKKKRRRLGKGQATGRGCTCGKGNKGQQSRSGGKIRPYFEGGQMPLQRRVPKRGFTSPSKKEFQLVNLFRLAEWDPEQLVTSDSLAAAGLVNHQSRPVKLLGNGDAPKGLKVRLDAVSGSARKKIEDAGGTVELTGAQTGADEKN